MIRDNDKNIDEYRTNHLDAPILPSVKDAENRYVDYKINFYEYPLFTLFCIVDTLEPLKSSLSLSEIDISLRKGKIIVKCNNSEYCKKVFGLNEWLLPTIKDENVISLDLDFL